MANDKTVTNYKYFIIAEILAVASFALNTINIISAKEGHGPMSSPWEVEFGLIYWLKNTCVVLGLLYLFKIRRYPKSEKMSIIFISLLITFLYSMPAINFLFQMLIGIPYKFIRGSLEPLNYFDRIPIQIIWSLPTLLVLVDLFKKSVLYLKRNEKN